MWMLVFEIIIIFFFKYAETAEAYVVYFKWL